MDFSPEYFEDEVKDGFYVPGMMKRAWAAQVEALIEVTKICDRNGIQIFAEWGTMLGAVRHGGFIPWDDDLDIVMLRKDYNRFLEVARKELPKRYVINNIHNMPNFDNLLTRLNTTQKTCVDQDFLEHYHGCACSVGIDVFCMDYVPRDPELQRQLKRSVKLLSSMKYQIEDVPKEEREEYIVPLEESLGVKIDRNKPLMYQYAALCEQVCAICTEEEADAVSIITLWEQNPNMLYPKKWYEKTIRIPFEGYEIPVPVGYDELLRYKYGDYMKQVRDYDSHNYPYFQYQYDELFYEILHRKQYRPGEVCLPRMVDTAKMRFEEECAKLMDVMGQVEALLQDATARGDQAAIKELSGATERLSAQAELLLAQEEQRKKKVVFLPAKASWWKALDTLWMEECENPDNQVYVIPLPYYHKDGFERIVDECYDGDDFPSEVAITHYNAIDLEKLHPDKIYIQVPFDGYNDSFTVHSYFFSEHLREMTDSLIYVPYFVLDDFSQKDHRAGLMTKYYVNMPGVVNSDYTILQSEQMKDCYIRSLVEWMGEDTREIWEEKLQPLGSSLYNHVYGEDYLNSRPLLANGKKILCFHMGVAQILRSIDRLEEILAIFSREKERVFVLWWDESKLVENLMRLDEEIGNRYLRLKERFCGEVACMVDDSQDRERLLAWCDAYYGDTSYVADLFCREKKPVMIMM